MNFKTIKARLFISYSVIIGTLVIVLSGIFYSYFSMFMIQQSSETIDQLANNISTQIEGELEKMNLLSQKIASSELLRELFFEDIRYYDKAPLYYNQQEINRVIYSITGPSNDSYQINLIDLDGKLIGFGNYFYYSFITKETLDSLDWLSTVKALDGKKFILSSHPDDWNRKKEDIVSLCRGFSDIAGMDAKAVIEIQLEYSEFIKTIQAPIGKLKTESLQNLSVYVFDNENHLFYPAEPGDAGQAEYYRQMAGEQEENKKLRLPDADSGKHDFVAFYKTAGYDWTVVIVVPEANLFRQVYEFRNTTIGLGFLILAITMVITYFIASGLTVPIKRINQSIHQFSLDNITPPLMEKNESSPDEMKQLGDAFQEMCVRLNCSLDEIVTIRSHELQARLLAMQAQMNPHFLYNTLSAISIIAEENKVPQIVDMCGSLSDMLRYISSDSTEPVFMSEELEHVESYMNLIKIRFGNRIRFHINVPEEMKSISIPKLVLQPLVENSVKFGTDAFPPWEIHVEGHMDGENWRVEVRDNGRGFSEERLKEIHTRLASAIPAETAPKMGIKGMGLVNIYTRLALTYGDKIIFELGNKPDGGGAHVTVGRKAH